MVLQSPNALLVALTGKDDPGGEQGGHSRLQRLWVQTVWEALKKAGMSADDGVVPITHPRDKLRLQSQRHAAFEAINLDDATAQHSAIADKYNAMALPSLETLATELRTNRWLCALLHHVVRHCGRGGEGDEDSARVAEWRVAAGEYRVVCGTSADDPAALEASVTL